MGQPNARRLQFSAIRELTSSANSDRQTLTQTALLNVGDTLEFWDRNASGCLETLVGTRTITAICPNDAIFLDSAIDLTSVTGTAVIRNRSIDDVREAILRLYNDNAESDDYLIEWSPAISASQLDTPIVGQSKQTVSDASCFAAGDGWALVSDEGFQGSGSVVAIDALLNTVTIDDSIDASGLTNPKLINTTVSMKQQFLRLKQAIDNVNAPSKAALDDGDCNNTAFEFPVGFVQNSSEVLLDGVAKRCGTAGTRASLVNDTGNAEITFLSRVLGLDGNDVDVEMVDPAGPSSPLSVTVSGTYDGQDRLISVSLETDGGSAIISTAAEVVAAINADADAKRLVQASYGGDGSGVQSALAQTPLAGGLDDGTGDYAELEELSDAGVSEGYKWISFHIRPDSINRMNTPPLESEEIDVKYTVAQ